MKRSRVPSTSEESDNGSTYFLFLFSFFFSIIIFFHSHTHLHSFFFLFSFLFLLFPPPVLELRRFWLLILRTTFCISVVILVEEGLVAFQTLVFMKGHEQTQTLCKGSGHLGTRWGKEQGQIRANCFTELLYMFWYVSRVVVLQNSGHTDHDSDQTDDPLQISKHFSSVGQVCHVFLLVLGISHKICTRVSCA